MIFLSAKHIFPCISFQTLVLVPLLYVYARIIDKLVETLTLDPS